MKGMEKFTDTKTILITPSLFGKYSPVLHTMREIGLEPFFPPYPHPLSEKQLLEFIPSVEGWIVGLDPVTKLVLEQAYRLKVIAKYGVGVDNIDVEEATRRGIVVANAPGSNDNAVAELTWGLILALVRALPLAIHSVRSKQWSRVVGVELQGKTLGVIGTGRIGKRVIQKASGFAMQVLAYDKVVDEDFARQYQVKYVSLEELLAESDVVTIHVPLTSETRGMIGRRELHLMKKTAYLVNTARGGIVDETALYETLKEWRIRGAALDAYAQEPPWNSPLLTLENVIPTPHAGADTEESLQQMDFMALENVIRVLEGREPLASVNYHLLKGGSPSWPS